MADRTDYVLMHGGGQGSWIWAELIAALRMQAGADIPRILALDAPGCGAKRGRDTAGLDLDAVVDELLAEIVAADLRDCVLVGHSQGGTVLPMLAARAPGRFRRLVHVSTIAPAPGETVLETMGEGRQGADPAAVGWPAARFEDPANAYRAMFCTDMPPAQAAAFLATLGADQWPAAVYPHRDWDAAQATPATYVACLRDVILPLAWQERFARRHGATRIVRLDTGHQAMMTRPHALAEILAREGAG